jgi:hypothetical protein
VPVPPLLSRRRAGPDPAGRRCGARVGGTAPLESWRRQAGCVPVGFCAEASTVSSPPTAPEENVVLRLQAARLLGGHTARRERKGVVRPMVNKLAEGGGARRERGRSALRDGATLVLEGLYCRTLNALSS